MALAFALVSSVAFAQTLPQAIMPQAITVAPNAVASQKSENFGDIKTFKKGFDSQIDKPVEGILYTTAENNSVGPAVFFPLQNAKLVLLDSSGNVVGHEAVTNEAGKFSFGTIKPGTYSILAEAVYEDGKRSFGVVRLNTIENAVDVDSEGEYILKNLSEIKLLLTDDLYYFDKDPVEKTNEVKVVKPENPVATPESAASTAAPMGGGALGSGMGALLGLGGLAGLAGLAGIDNNHHNHPVSSAACCCY